LVALVGLSSTPSIDFKYKNQLCCILHFLGILHIAMNLISYKQIKKSCHVGILEGVVY
jgi:hypothetical protein